MRESCELEKKVKEKDKLIKILKDNLTILKMAMENNEKEKEK